jgi:hypothetical protein
MYVQKLLKEAVAIEGTIQKKESSAAVIKRILDVDDYVTNMNELTKLITRHDIIKANKKHIDKSVKKVDRILTKMDKRDELLIPLQELVSSANPHQQDYVTKETTREDELFAELTKEISGSARSYYYEPLTTTLAPEITRRPQYQHRPHPCFPKVQCLDV